MSTKPPADPPMDRTANPVRPATAPAPRKPVVAPPPPRSGFQRFVLQFLLLVIALGGAYFTGYHVNANEMLLERNDLQQQQLDAQERILALEKQLADLQERRESGNRVELDLTEVFEPIREAVGRIALVRMGEISREITTELTRLVEDDLTSLDDPTNATGGGVAPGGMIGGSPTPGQKPEAASATGDTARPPTADAPNPPQPSSAALGLTEPPGQPEAVDPADDAGGTEPAAVPAASNSPPADALPAAGLDLAESVEGAASQEAARRDAADGTAGRSGISNPDDSAPPEPTVVAELESPRRPNSSGGAPALEP